MQRQGLHRSADVPEPVHLWRSFVKAKSGQKHSLSDLAATWQAMDDAAKSAFAEPAAVEASSRRRRMRTKTEAAEQATSSTHMFNLYFKKFN